MSIPVRAYTSGDLGYAAQTFGVATLGNTLFTLTNTNVYTFEISAVPEPPAALLFGTGALLLLLLRGTPLARVLGSRC